MIIASRRRPRRRSRERGPRQRDLFIENGRIVAAPDGGRAIALRVSRPRRDGGRHRHPQPRRGRQGQPGAAADGRGPSRGRRAQPAPARGQRLRTPSSFITGYRYAAMGYTAAFEPAMVPRTRADASRNGRPADSSTRAPMSCSAMTSCCCSGSPTARDRSGSTTTSPG